MSYERMFLRVLIVGILIISVVIVGRKIGARNCKKICKDKIAVIKFSIPTVCECI